MGAIQDRASNYDDMAKKYEESQKRGENKVLKRLGAKNIEEAKGKVLEEIQHRANLQKPTTENKYTGTVIKDPESSAIHALRKELVEGFVKTAITPDQSQPQPLGKGRATQASS